MDMISTVMQPAASGQPGWLAASIGFSIRLLTPHIRIVNGLVVVLQALIGGFLVLGTRRQQIRAAWVSMLWGLLVWWFGEGFGEVLTGTGTFLSGSPGSVLLYVAAGAVLVADPEEIPDMRVGRYVLSVGNLVPGALFALATAFELNPLFFTPLGLASAVGQGAMMAQPEWVRTTLDWAIRLLVAYPVWINAALVIAFAVLAGGSLLSVYVRSWALLAGTLSVLFLVWWFGQDVGGLLTGMATDPNTAVPLAVWAVVGALETRGTPHFPQGEP